MAAKRPPSSYLSLEHLQRVDAGQGERRWQHVSWSSLCFTYTETDLKGEHHFGAAAVDREFNSHTDTGPYRGKKAMRYFQWKESHLADIIMHILLGQWCESTSSISSVNGIVCYQYRRTPWSLPHADAHTQFISSRPPRGSVVNSFQMFPLLPLPWDGAKHSPQCYATVILRST